MARTIFISHSKDDSGLVQLIDHNFRQIDIIPILEEYSPESDPPYAKIERDIMNSLAVFVFLTQNTKMTDYTQNWVTFEITKATDLQKPTFVIEDINNPIHFPIPKLENYILYDPTKTEDWGLLQNIANRIKEQVESKKSPLLGALAGAIVGAVISEEDNVIGAVVGSILGGIFGALISNSSKPLRKPYRFKCGGCGIVFNFYTNMSIESLDCPSCRTKIYLPV